MSDEYQDGCMVASQVIEALKLAIERYGDLPVTYSDDSWGDAPVRFISFQKEYTDFRKDKLPQRISMGTSWPQYPNSDAEIITRVKKIGEMV